MRASNSPSSPFRIMTVTTVPLAAAMAVEVTAAAVVMNKSNRDISNRCAAADLDNSGEQAQLVTSKSSWMDGWMQCHLLPAAPAAYTY